LNTLLLVLRCLAVVHASMQWCTPSKQYILYFLRSEIKLPLLFESSGNPNGCLL
jgi:hypothetical protein